MSASRGSGANSGVGAPPRPTVPTLPSVNNLLQGLQLPSLISGQNMTVAMTGPSFTQSEESATMEGNVDKSKHPSGIIPTLQYFYSLSLSLPLSILFAFSFSGIIILFLKEFWKRCSSAVCAWMTCFVVAFRNIVSTVNLGCKLDLKQIALKARNAEYNPKRFAAVIMRIREPKTTALIFSSGKMVCTGAKSEEASRLAARKYARIIQKLGFPTKFLDFKIQNIVGSCDVRFPIRLEGLAFAHAKYSSYEPELFPGLIYRMVQPKIVLLIFVSGKIVLTGAKVREEIYEAFENIYPVLNEFKKN